MAKFVLKDAIVHYEGRDLSGELSSVGFEVSITTPESTTFGNNSVRRLPGIIDITFIIFSFNINKYVTHFLAILISNLRRSGIKIQISQQ